MQIFVTTLTLIEKEAEKLEKQAEELEEKCVKLQNQIEEREKAKQQNTQ